MTTFDEGRQVLRDARDKRARAGDDLLAARQRLQRLEAQQKENDRAFDPKDPAQVKQREALDKAHAAAVKDADSAAAVVRGVDVLETDAVRNFAALSDPRRAIAQLDDGIP